MGIPVLAEIERLITEHGSAAILRERLALASDQYSALEKKVKDFQSENVRLASENEQMKEQIRNLKSTPHQSSNPQGYVCDHCGSSNLTRTGSRKDPIFGDLGAKQAIFRC
jgi:hypothetical protein